MPAVEIRPFNVRTPSGTPTTNPLVTELTMPSREIDRIEILVPPGPRGELGFRITSGGQPVIPADNADWIITDNEHISWDLEELPNSGALELTSYNTGQFDHTIYIRFLTSLVAQPSAPSPGPIPPSQLGSAPPPPIPV